MQYDVPSCVPMGGVPDLDYLNGSVVCRLAIHKNVSPYGNPYRQGLPQRTYIQIKRYKGENRGKWGEQQSVSPGLFQGKSTQAKTTKIVGRRALADESGMRFAHA